MLSRVSGCVLLCLSIIIVVFLYCICINYMFVILLYNCTWYKSCTFAFYMTSHNLHENQQHRNNIVLTYRVNLVPSVPIGYRLGDWYSVRRLEGAARSLFDWDSYKLDVRSSITRGKWLFAGRLWFDSRLGHIFCFSPQLQSF
jgi:hypothetical protein